MPTPDGKIKVMALVPTMRTGGAERVISLLLQQLDRRRFEPELAIVYEAEMAYAVPDDVPVHVLAREPAVHTAAAHYALPPDLEARYSRSAAWMMGISDKLVRLAQDRQPDIVISSPMWASILAAVSHDALPASTRLISRVDAPPSVSLAQSDLQDLFTYFVREHFNKSDRIIAVSRAVGTDLVENFGVSPDLIEVVNNPVDISRIRELAQNPVDDPWFEEDVPIVLFVGRLERVKGLEYLLRAIDVVRTELPVRCVLVGDGSHRGYLQALAKHLGITERVRFAGRQSNPFKYLSKATAFVLPSLSEGMPNVLLEAMTCGCPVIASDIAGGITREVLNEGEYGLIVPREDDEALAAAILRMLRDEALRQEFARRGLGRAEMYDVPKVMEHNQELISAVASMEPVEQPGPVRVPRRIANEEEDTQEEPRVPPAPETERDAHVVQDVGAGSTAALKRTSHLERWRLRVANAARMTRSEGLVAFGSHVVRRLRSGTDAQRVSPDPPRLAGHRRYPEKIGLSILVPCMDDAFMGSGTEVLLRHLDRSVFEISLIEIDEREAPGQVPDDVERYLIEARPVDMRGSGGSVPADVAKRYADEVGWLFASAVGLTDMLKGLSTDVVIAQGFYASIVATLAKSEMDSTAVTLVNMHSHAFDFDNIDYGGQYLASLIRAYFNSADIVLAPDESIRKDLVEKLGVDAVEVTVVPDPIDLGVPRAQAQEPTPGHEWLQQSDPVFLSVIGPGADNGLRYLMQAVAQARRHEPVRCLIAGEGAPRDAVEELAKEAGVRGAVDLLGEHVSLRAAMCGATALVHSPSEADFSIPNAFIDAAGTGRPIISARSSEAVCEFLGHGLRGVVVPMKDASALADAMLQVVWDDEAACEMVRLGGEHLKAASSDVVIPRIEQMILDSMRGRRGGPSSE